MNLPLYIYPYALVKVQCHILPYCWFWNGDGAGYIYRSGFETLDNAFKWAIREGIMTQEDIPK